MVSAGIRPYTMSSIGALMDPAYLREAVGASTAPPWRGRPAGPTFRARLSTAGRQCWVILRCATPFGV